MKSKSAVDLISSPAKDSSVTENYVDGEFVVIKEESLTSRCEEMCRMSPARCKSKYWYHFRPEHNVY